MKLDIRNRFLTDKDSARLYALYPELKADWSKYCPNCQTTGTYLFQGEENQCDCQYALQLYKWYLHSGIGDHYARLSMADYDGDPGGREWVEKYLNHHEKMTNKGLGLLFHGTFGTGKTFLATMVIKELIKLGYTCFCTTFTGMTELFTAGWSSGEDKRYFHDRMKGSQILFIDDIGKEFRTKTNLAESTLDDVLRARVQSARPTFITTNMTPREMRTGYGGAVFSLLQEVSIAHEVKGRDQRPNVIARHLDEIENNETRPVV